MSTRLVHIAPELPSTVGGVADYTAILSQRLVEASDGTVEPVLMHAGNQPTEAIDVPFPVEDLSGECSATALAQAIERLAAEADGRAVVLLEYSGYGYASRGAPLWLARGLRRVCGENGVPLITMFHELYATGPPWTSTFWISGAQRFVAAFLAQMSSTVLTNRSGSTKWVRRYAASSIPVETKPVFSNVGEPKEGVSDRGRRSLAVVFGGGRKENVYDGCFLDLSGTLVDGGVTEMIDVGPPVPIPRQTEGTRIRKRGILPKEEVSRILSDAQIGILYCPLDHLTKSGVMAAYLAHGVAPLIVGAQNSTDALEKGTHFLTVKELRHHVHEGARTENLSRHVGRAGRKWYEEHAHSRRTAQSLISLIRLIE